MSNHEFQPNGEGTAHTVFAPSAEAYTKFSPGTIGYRVSEGAIGDAMMSYFQEHHDSRINPFNLLEIGSGTGQSSMRIVDSLDGQGVWFRHVSTEPTAKMIEAGKKVNAQAAAVDNLARSIIPSVQTRAENLSHSQFPDNSFDIVFGSQVVHWIDDLPTAFREAHRVLLPEGQIILAGSGIIKGERALDDAHFTRHASYREFLKNIQQQLEQDGRWDKSKGEFEPTNPKVNPLFHRYDVTTVAGALVDAGFTNVNRTYHRAPINRAEMLLRMSSGNASMFLFAGEFAKEMNDNDRALIVDAARTKVLEEYPELLEDLNQNPVEDSTLLFTAEK